VVPSLVLAFSLTLGPAWATDSHPTREFLTLKAHKIDDSHLILSWTDPNEVMVQGYNVYSREGAKGVFFKLNSRLLRTSQYYLTATTKSHFSFQVRQVLQVDPLREGATSLELMFSPKMKAVNKKDLDPSPRGRIDLVKAAQMAKWTNPGEKHLAGYNAYYCEKPKGAYIRANEAPFGKDEAVMKYLEPGKTYYLVFTALGANGKESEPSKVLSAEAQMGPAEPNEDPSLRP
jgi:hypothetical protein